MVPVAAARRKRRIVYVGLALFLCTVVALLLGALYNDLAIRRLRNLYPPPGTLYSVGGYEMHLYCSGSGSPTVLLDGGLGSDWIDWQQLQPTLAKVTRVCSYDRAGLGWSEPQPGPRDAIRIADQLHKLLHAAGVAGPFIFIGQSAGGLYAREFVANHMRDVAGLVLVDSTPPESFERIPANRESSHRHDQRHRAAWWQAIEDGIGLSRLLGRCRGFVRPGLTPYSGHAFAEACRPRYDVSWLGEVDDFEISADEVADTKFDDLPLLIISQDPDRPKSGWTAQEIAANPIWAAMQEDLKMLSKRTRRIIAKGSGHHVQNDRPDAIGRAVTEMIAEINGIAQKSKFDGTTVVW